MSVHSTAPGELRGIGLLWAGVVIVLVAVFWFLLQPLSLKASALDAVPRLLGMLAIVALFIERFVEVFVAVWRKPEADMIEVEVVSFERLKAEKGFEYKPSGNQGESVGELLQDAEQKQVGYRGDTQKFALSLGVLIGVIVAAGGFCFLDNLIDKNAPAGTSAASYPAWRIAILNVIDVLLTGAVLAAGTEPIHKILTLFTSFMEVTKKKIESGV